MISLLKKILDYILFRGKLGKPFEKVKIQIPVFDSFQIYKGGQGHRKKQKHKKKTTKNTKSNTKYTTNSCNINISANKLAIISFLQNPNIYVRFFFAEIFKGDKKYK